MGKSTEDLDYDSPMPRDRWTGLRRPRRNSDRIQTATWGILIIWVGIMLGTKLDNDHEGLGMTVLGSIFLVSGLLQRIAGEHGGVGFVIAGLTLTLIGVNDLVGDDQISVAAIVVVIVGTVILLSALRKPRVPDKVDGSDDA